MTTLDLTTFHFSTESRAALQAQIDAGDFVLETGINATDFTKKCYKIAVIDPAYQGITEFRGTPISGAGLIVAALQYGDANYDGAVNLDDYTEYLANLNSATPTDSWENGAFNGTHDVLASAPDKRTNYFIFALQTKATE